MRTMYDSITAADIPADAQIVGGYVSGSFQWSPAGWARFPNAVHVRFATHADVNDGNILDVERYDATPDQAPGWVTMRRAAGVSPSVYCNETALPTVRAAFQSAGVAEPPYMVAHYDGVASIPAGCVAKQYETDPQSGGHFDLSAVADYWPGIDQEVDMPLTEADALLVTNDVWRQPIWSGKNPDGSTWQMSPSQVLLQLDNENKALAAQVTALADAVAKLAAGLPTIVDQAVAQHIAITGTVQIAGK